jgi:two-component system CheB/CheR fusion protein
LHDHEEEADYLYLELAGSSVFFGNKERIEILKRKVFPEIANRQVADAPLRVWLPGCRTGEEAYSGGIAFREFSESQARRILIRFFATDENARAIWHASPGTYPRTIVNDVSPGCAASLPEPRTDNGSMS